jgi:hypothetical protein
MQTSNLNTNISKESLILAGLEVVMIRGGFTSNEEPITDKDKFSVVGIDCDANICCTILSNASFEEAAEAVGQYRDSRYDSIETT